MSWPGDDAISAMCPLHEAYRIERLGPSEVPAVAPGYDREMVAPGVVKRVYEAFYAKVLVREEDLLRP